MSHKRRYHAPRCRGATVIFVCCYELSLENGFGVFIERLFLVDSLTLMDNLSSKIANIVTPFKSYAVNAGHVLEASSDGGDQNVAQWTSILVLIMFIVSSTYLQTLLLIAQSLIYCRHHSLLIRRCHHLSDTHSHTGARDYRSIEIDIQCANQTAER